MSKEQLGYSNVQMDGELVVQLVQKQRRLSVRVCNLVIMHSFCNEFNGINK